MPWLPEAHENPTTTPRRGLTGRPQPGDMQERYWTLGRVDLARGPRGWWVTIWACRPPPPASRFRVLVSTWHGPVRVVREVERLP